MYKKYLKQSHVSTRYIKFIEHCSSLNDDLEKGEYEYHHVLPRCLYKKYAKEKWNIVKLTHRQHFIAHWMLAKIYGGKMWFAFNQMRRIGNKSVLYEYGRKYISECIRNANSGLIRDKKFCEDVSKRTKNKVVVKYKGTEKTFQVDVDDPRYVSGEVVFYRTGTKHKQETKDKMSKNSGLTGKRGVVINDRIKFFREDEIPDGVEFGLPQSTKEKVSVAMSKLIWVSIATDNGYVNKRIPTEDFDPTLHEKGRKGYKGWDYLNSKRRKT